MIFPGIKNEQEIKDLTAFIEQFDKDGGRRRDQRSALNCRHSITPGQGERGQETGS